MELRKIWSKWIVFQESDQARLCAPMPIFDYSHQLFDHLIHFTLHNGHPPSPLFHLPPRFLMIIFPSILLQKRIPFRVAQPSAVQGCRNRGAGPINWQRTLSQLRRGAKNLPTTLLFPCPPDFKTFRHPCSAVCAAIQGQSHNLVLLQKTNLEKQKFFILTDEIFTYIEKVHIS